MLAVHCSTPVPLQCGNLLSYVRGWALSEMVQCYLGFVVILGNEDGIVLMQRLFQSRTGEYYAMCLLLGGGVSSGFALKKDDCVFQK